VEEFDYQLPEELIAKYPPERREASRMMVLRRDTQEIEHRYFWEITKLIDENYLLVLNDTRVIPARLFGRKETGANVEVLLSKRLSEDLWECITRPARRLKKGTKIIFTDILYGIVEDVLTEGKRVIRFFPEGGLLKHLQAIGEIPLPPYIKRSPERVDYERYQTVFAKKNGSIAAPTAGLHFTPEILEALKRRGVEIRFITLHVGLGTFKPVKSERVENHKMEEEFFEIPQETAEAINIAKAEGRKILACGTTVTRALESAAREKGRVEAISGWTNLFIYPGYEFKVVDALLTNFPLPKSTLLMLVCAFAGREFVMRAYHEAIKRRYRFYSYGDCMLIL